MTESYVIDREVRAALAEGRPVVALETAVLTHGLPPPHNLRALRAMESAVVQQGAVPAAVAVVLGEVRVGLGVEEKEALGSGAVSAKAGLADLPIAVARGVSAGTTVAATLWASRRAGIEVFATGGIGGVHRDAETTFDVSGDLLALSRLGGCVVCSGAKAILDLRRTFEALETLGVTVVAFGTDEVPAFLSRSSGLRAAHRADDPEEVARLLRARDRLGLPQTVLVVNPPPPDVALPPEDLEAAVTVALSELRDRGVAGRAVTPFLLSSIGRSTQGAAVEANVRLLEGNARLAALIARALKGVLGHGRPRAGCRAPTVAP